MDDYVKAPEPVSRPAFGTPSSRGYEMPLKGMPAVLPKMQSCYLPPNAFRAPHHWRCSPLKNLARSASFAACYQPTPKETR